MLVTILGIETARFTLPLLVDGYEGVSFALVPSAQKAFDYGDFHFSASNPEYYDINLAQYYFYKAAAMDPYLPLVWHQLARTSFINDDLIKALDQIDIQIAQEGDAVPNSYYMRGLIEAYMKDYPAAEQDYAHFFKLDPISWAGANDYAWVLLKDGKPQLAAQVVEGILTYEPDNAWLLNSDAIARSEMGDATTARERLDEAAQAVSKLTPADWAIAYPGNDPNIDSEGLEQFKQAVQDNIHSIDTGKTI